MDDEKESKAAMLSEWLYDDEFLTPYLNSQKKVTYLNKPDDEIIKHTAKLR